jgi:predicted metalloprotease
MRWDEFGRSENIEDRRGDGSGGGLLRGGGGLGLGTMVVLGLLGWALGIDPRLLIGGAEMLSGARQRPHAVETAQTRKGVPADQMGQFISAIVAANETVWTEILPRQTKVRYVPPTLVLFSGATRSACGPAQSAMGPFYCPLDRKVYLDTSFFQDMQRRMGAGGDFAYAYVIAHEIGHHVENLLGILPKVPAVGKPTRSRCGSS